ncbi:HAD family hydrolase [Stagnihabitans tardus]|uniref:HAD-IA family hydrolase n=1 Tax=Stagnihabitans tardus TaxID=2699202 RepID=A0AAE5BV14_9RHOB|nr:HAD family phosphatase [Stagnihabitans tardus]NBZ86703.1 HAD-IA family hydrolase [Stagnihabitans tardus]
MSALYDALLFDLDGTLIDTETIAMASGAAAFAAVGHPVEETFLHRLIGVDQPTSVGIILGHRPGIDLDALNRLWAEGFQAGMAGGLTLKPGVFELLEATPGHIHRAVVTSSGREGAHHKIRLAGLAPSFATVVTVDDVTRPKPDPEPYLLAARMLGVDPRRCLVFEDSETGAEAAHRAGCTVVQVPDMLPSQGRWAHHVAEDLVLGARMAGLL